MITFKEILDNLAYEFLWRFRRIRGFYRDCLNATVHKWRLGFNPADTWNLDFSIAEYILPRLKHFKKNHHGHPTSMTDRQWERELDKMISSFEMILKNEKYMRHDMRQQKVIDDGLVSFAKHFQRLWD